MGWRQEDREDAAEIERYEQQERLLTELERIRELLMMWMVTHAETPGQVDALMAMAKEWDGTRSVPS